MKLSFTFLLLGIILGCSLNETTENVKSLSVIQEEVLVDSLDGQYKEWYAGRKQLKYIGGQDSKGRRHGRWTHYLSLIHI